MIEKEKKIAKCLHFFHVFWIFHAYGICIHLKMLQYEV